MRLARARGRRAACAIEYCLVISLVTMVLIAGVQHLGGAISNPLDEVAGYLGGSGQDQGGGDQDSGDQGSGNDDGNAGGGGEDDQGQSGKGKGKGQGNGKGKALGKGHGKGNPHGDD